MVSTIKRKMSMQQSDLILRLMEVGDKHPYKRINLGTHNGEFHADELLATAVLTHELKPLGYDVHIVRSRDIDYLNETCAVVYDVGGGRYDHHDREKVFYPNGVPMAACGKILNDVVPSGAMLDSLRHRLFYAVEANDNGYPVPDYIETSKLAFVSAFNPTWKEPRDNKSMFMRFVKILPVVQQIYERTIEQVKADIQSFDVVEKSPKILEGKFILLKRYCSFYSYAQLHHEVLGAIYPRDGQFHVRLSPTFKRKYETKIRFPEEWGGKSGQLLKDASGISGACFCHSSRFLATFETERDAIKACELLTEENNV